jgi:hypothetical protein
MPQQTLNGIVKLFAAVLFAVAAGWLVTSVVNAPAETLEQARTFKRYAMRGLGALICAWLAYSLARQGWREVRQP